MREHTAAKDATVSEVSVALALPVESIAGIGQERTAIAPQNLLELSMVLH